MKNAEITRMAIGKINRAAIHAGCVPLLKLTSPNMGIESSSPTVKSVIIFSEFDHEAAKTFPEFILIPK